MGRTVGISALTVMLGILIGGALAEEHSDPVDRAEHEGAPAKAKILAVDGR
jgi:hypothetical protein